jgi:hypothetical protein
MIRLDGTAADEVRLAAASDIADLFKNEVIGLFLNVLPALIVEGGGLGAIQAAERLVQRLACLEKPLRRRHFGRCGRGIAAREARVADAFMALRLRGRRKSRV